MTIEGTRAEISKIINDLGLNDTIISGSSFEIDNITFRIVPSAKEFLEAVEKCVDNQADDSFNYCEGCPYDSYYESCSDNMMLDAKRIIENLISGE